MRVPAILPLVIPLLGETYSRVQNVVLTNDDGWAVAQIRAQYAALTEAGFDVVLSAPAQNESGKGSSSTAPTPLSKPCEYDSCPTGSPAEGFNASDPHLNYVNAYPVDAVRYGIQTLAPQFFDGEAPDFVVSGPNIGNNLALSVFFSGTVGAACEAAQEGISSAAFSGDSGSQVSYTTLTSEPNATSSQSARIYAALTSQFIQTILTATPAGSTVLPSNVTLNVNYPSIDGCAYPSDYKWVLSRNEPNLGQTDVETCGSTALPWEVTVVNTSGCYASVSVISATSKSDVNATLQAAVLGRLTDLPLSCLSS
ncbi:hypothetical protein POSPLADRAFT_1154831 [Postia placenta MAD-698-R-SB12]|uniref:Survival protein SurE-like phosphatase/nucleotidase domain-containing protein n=1 Tax=Postia placenta MAD-698-R-SB12 TaxID=670580 RepID=A0A1X6MNP3_9APHY|nr:hypothetical protein POSPLADRAFT_1154831 [Postia placenta MAD-698-R-SB12]OSX57960.1 hypothetical protein POSPLADRAFT_1154831 [Postia placenta MAD-698-R-SB12]